MTFIAPILKRTVITGDCIVKDGRGKGFRCTHPDVTHLGIERKLSLDKERPYIAIERSQCKFCDAYIEEFWLTAYPDYESGVAAMGVANSVIAGVDKLDKREG